VGTRDREAVVEWDLLLLLKVVVMKGIREKELDKRGEQNGSQQCFGERNGLQQQLSARFRFCFFCLGRHKVAAKKVPV
jgi:hypothetical protein